MSGGFLRGGMKKQSGMNHAGLLHPIGAVCPIHEYVQMHFHISEVLSIDQLCYLNAAQNIDVPVLFLNGEWDEYTAAEDSRLFGEHVANCQFTTLQSTGHFLDMEHKTACSDSQKALLNFLKPEAAPKRSRYHHVQNQYAFAL